MFTYVFTVAVFSSLFLYITFTGFLSNSNLLSNSLLRVLFVLVFSCVQLFVTPWTVAHQAPLSVEFSRQAYWSGLPFPPPGDLLNPGIESESSALQVDSLPLSHWGKQEYSLPWGKSAVKFILRKKMFSQLSRCLVLECCGE